MIYFYDPDPDFLQLVFDKSQVILPGYCLRKITPLNWAFIRFISDTG